MAMGRARDLQNELWVATEDVRTPAHPFYERLNGILAAHKFDEQVEALCKPFYAERDGRPSIPPGLYFRMIMIGYFEGIDSERGIVWRCQDSLSLRAFLGLKLHESPPDQSTLSITRRRLPAEVIEEYHKIVLRMLLSEGLLKGQNLALDASVSQANAAMRSIVRRDTGKSQLEYARELAEKEGEVIKSTEDLIRFDQKRKRTTSNADWVSPTDSDAKVARMKDGRTRMAYKPEHAVDIDTGAIVVATLNQADLSDHDTATETIAELIETLGELGVESRESTIVADKGYHSEQVIAGCTAAEINTCIAVPQRKKSKNPSPKSKYAQEAIARNCERAKSASGRKLLRKRGETVERSFALVLDKGRMRRLFLRGQINAEKRYLIQVAAYNLGILMRAICGFGTPKGLADARKASFSVLDAMGALSMPFFLLWRLRLAQRFWVAA